MWRNARSMPRSWRSRRLGPGPKDYRRVGKFDDAADCGRVAAEVFAVTQASIEDCDRASLRLKTGRTACAVAESRGTPPVDDEGGTVVAAAEIPERRIQACDPWRTRRGRAAQLHRTRRGEPGTRGSAALRRPRRARVGTARRDPRGGVGGRRGERNCR